jgi:hypothetical protein
LKDKKLDSRTRAMALMFLVHLVGDLHQPLHAVDRNKDRGGNNVFIRLGRHAGRLHGLWDSFFVEPLEEADLESSPGVSGGSPRSWAWESYEVARTVVYRGVPVQPSTAENPIVLPDPGYREAAVPIVKARLKSASVRLADLLAKTLSR